MVYEQRFKDPDRISLNCTKTNYPKTNDRDECLKISFWAKASKVIKLCWNQGQWDGIRKEGKVLKTVGFPKACLTSTHNTAGLLRCSLDVLPPFNLWMLFLICENVCARCLGLTETRAGRKDVSVPETLNVLGSWTMYKIREQRYRGRGRPHPAHGTRSGLGPGDSRGRPSTPRAKSVLWGPSWRRAGRFWVMVWAADVQFCTLFGHWFESGRRYRDRGADSWLSCGPGSELDPGRRAARRRSPVCWPSSLPEALPGGQRSPSWCCGTLRGSGVAHSPGDPELHASLLGRSSCLRRVLGPTPTVSAEWPRDTGKSSHSSSPHVIHEAISTISPQIRTR